MQRIDNPPTDLFVDGDPATGTPGTVVTAGWLNAVQEELAYIVEQAGITLSGADNTQVLEAIQNIATTGFTGLVQRPMFRWKDADEIYIGPGGYHHNGTSEQYVKWASELTFQFGSVGSNADSDNLAVSDWFYVYLDDSAIVTKGDNIITAAQIVAKTMEPTWNAAKRGWYNGNDRCIFAVRTDGSGNLCEFSHSGDLVLYDSKINDIWNVTIGTTWTDVALTIPKFSRSADVCFYQHYDTQQMYAYWRQNGSAGSEHLINYSGSTDPEQHTRIRVITDDTQKIEIKQGAASGGTIGVSTHGFYFPGHV